MRLIVQRTARNSKPIEVLGTYDPIPKQSASEEGRKYKDIKLDISRTKYWLGVGAQPSDPAWRLMAMVRDHSLVHVMEATAEWIRRSGRGAC